MGDRVNASASSPQNLVFYSNATQLRIGTDVVLTALVVAPDAAINVYSRADITGCLGGRDVNLEPDVLLDGTDAALPLAPAGTASCDDDLKDGEETDIDCGGPTCQHCANGQSCLASGDCVNGVCTGGHCQTGGSVSATTQVTADWGSGYCVTLRVTNHATAPTTSWVVSLNTNHSGIYTNWNGVFSGSSGALTIGPVSWNSAIAPGATNDSIGFCANREQSGSGLLPNVLGASATF